MDNKRKLAYVLLFSALGIALIGIIFSSKSISFSFSNIYEKEKCDIDEIDLGFYSFERWPTSYGSIYYVFPSSNAYANYEDSVKCQDITINIKLTKKLKFDIYAPENNFLELFGIYEAKSQFNENVMLVIIEAPSGLWTTIILPKEMTGRKQCVVSLSEKKVMFYNSAGDLELERYMLYEWQTFPINEIKNSISHEVVFKTADGRQLRLPIRKIKTVEDIESDNKEYIEYNVSFEGSDRQRLIVHTYKSDVRHWNENDRNFVISVLLLFGGSCIIYLLKEFINRDKNKI